MSQSNRPSWKICEAIRRNRSPNCVNFSLWVRLRGQSHRIDTVTQPRWLWSIVKYVPQMSVAAAALYFGSPHAVAGVSFSLHGLFAGRSVETGPSGAGVVFRLRTKQGLAAAGTFVRSCRFGVLVFTSKGRFRPFLPGHKVLILGELLLPGSFVFANLAIHSVFPSRCV